MQLITIANILLATISGSNACGIHVRLDSPSNLERRIPEASLSTSKTVINNARVWNGLRFQKPRTVVIDGGIIGIDPRDADVTIDAEGRYLIPGLMESHGHAYTVQALEAYSGYGVTTALNLNCPNYTICDMLKSQVGLTSLRHAGTPVIAPGSDHARANLIPDSMLIRSVDMVEDLVKWTADNGSDFMKIVSEGNGPTQDMQDAVVEACNKRGLPSTTHASWLLPYEQAVNSGATSIQHIAGDSPIPQDVIRKMKQQGQFSTPTLTVHRYVADNPDIREIMQGTRETNQSFAIHRDNVSRFHKAGIPLLAGSDAVGVNDIFNLPHGLMLHRELENLIEAGLSPAEVLRAATSVPARLHKFPDRGVIAPGKRADLVLLNSDPLANISNTQDIARVWIEGIEFANVTRKM